MKIIRYCLAVVLISGCVGTEVGNPVDDGESEVTVDFSAEIADPRALTLSNGLEVTEAWIAFEEVGLRDAERCEETERYDNESPFAVELVAGTEVPGAPMLTVPGTEFCELELEVEALPDDFTGAPSPLLDDAVLVRGELEDGTPFEARVTFSETVEFETSFTTDRQTRLLVTFDLNQWLSASDFDNATTQPDGTLLLDSEADGEAIERIAGAIERSARLIRDNNANGLFDEGDDIVAESNES